MSKVLGVDALTGIRDWVKSEDDAVKAELRTYVGSPLVASTVAGMTDQTKVYVYTGSETGYTAGNWYYYNGSAWTSGGVYNSTALETDPTLTIAGMAADAKATGDEITNLKQDINELETSMETKADIDGTYDQMTVGNAEQLATDKGIVERVPYLLRASGGNGADREQDKIVGGTVAWNQLIQNGNFENTNNWRVYTLAKGNLSASNNVLTITYSAEGNGGYSFGLIYTKTITIQTNHIYIIKAEVNVDFNTQIAFEIGTGIRDNLPIQQNKWTEVALLGAKPSWTSSNAIILKPVNSTIVVGSTMKVRNYMLIDVTQMFGSAIAEYVYNLDIAQVGAGVAWFKKLFPKDYYPYDAGSLKSVEGLTAHSMVGFNQFDANTATWVNGKYIASDGSEGALTNYNYTSNYIKVLPNTEYCYSVYKTAVLPNDTSLSIAFYDGEKQFISRTSPSVGTNTIGVQSTTFTTTANTNYIRLNVPSVSINICINLSDPAKNGTYEPYVKHSYPLDSSLTLRGIPKLDANNQVYYDGDEYAADGTVTRKYGIVDLGTMNWTAGYEGFYNNTTLYYLFNWAGAINTQRSVCAKYAWSPYATRPDKSICFEGSSHVVIIKDSAYTDAATFKASLSGVYLVYELATPTTEEADPYQNHQILDPYGTEAYETTGIVPVGHETFYPENLRAKIEGLPFNFATLIAPTESTYKATRAYSANNLFIVDNILYKATTSIASGGTITPGTNCTATTLAEIIAALS